MPKREKFETGPVLADVDTGARVRIEAEVVGQGGVIGRALQVGTWRGPVAVSIPVQVLGSDPAPDAETAAAEGEPLRLADVAVMRRVLVEVETIGGIGTDGGTRVRVGRRDTTMPGDTPVWLLAE